MCEWGQGGREWRAGCGYGVDGPVDGQGAHARYLRLEGDLR